MSELLRTRWKKIYFFTHVFKTCLYYISLIFNHRFKNISAYSKSALGQVSLKLDKPKLLFVSSPFLIHKIFEKSSSFLFFNYVFSLNKLFFRVSFNLLKLTIHIN